MEFFKHHTKIDFMSQRKWAALLSILLFAFSLGTLFIKGLQWGLDFTGGTQIEMKFDQPVDLSLLRDRLSKGGFQDATIVSYGTSKEVLITLAAESTQSATSSSDAMETKQVNQVKQVLSDGTVQQVNFIGPQVGQEMVGKSLYAIFFALLGTMIYIAIRFDLRFSIGSTVALIHDPVLILGVFSFFRIEFNLISLAAVLTVIGYSLNDTIVIFDRVRENFRKLRKADAYEVMNQAINQTLSRTIMTSVITLTVVLALFFLGGSLLHGFSLALIVGIIVGTYSSIYVAGSLSLALGVTRAHLVPAAKVVDDRP